MHNIFENKKVLVAGGAGFVGTNLIIKLLELNAAIRATFHVKKPVISDRRIEYLKCDLTDRNDCKKAVKNIDYVFMCAANTSGAAVIEGDPLSHVTPNVIMNTLMLDAAYKEGVKKFLWISSNTVYPDADHHVRESEAMIAEPYEKYFCVGWMKRFTEILCRMYAEKIKKPMNVVVVRPANIYGPFDDFEWATSHVLPALIRKIVERHDPVEVWGDGNDIKDFIYVEDFVEGTLLAMEKLDKFTPVNIGTGRMCSIKEALEAMLLADSYKGARIVYNSSKPTMIPRRLIDVSLAKKLLGFEAGTSLKEGIKKTISWYRESRIKR